jgi:hypothetical protein
MTTQTIEDPKNTQEYKRYEEAKEAFGSCGQRVVDLLRQKTKLETTITLTDDQFYRHALVCVEPGIEYVLDKFDSSDGPYMGLMQMLKAAELFNPLVAKGKGMDWMRDRIQLLSSFGFAQFKTQRLLVGIEGELELYTQVLNLLFEWDEVDGAESYNKKQQKQNDGSDSSWREDSMEVARRVWEWWRYKKDDFLYITEAVRLVALVQTSSASVERVFSQLGLILDVVGTQALDETMELRIFERVNSQHY